MICEICGKEILNLNSNRFCSKHCRYVYIGKQVNKNGKHVCNFNKCTKCKNDWKCSCGKNFRTKKLLINHKSECELKNCCKYCLKIFENSYKLGGHIANCNKNPNHLKHLNNIKIANGLRKNIPISDKQKEKISKSLKLYLKEHPDKIPYLLNNHRNGESYPEKYFREIFEKDGYLLNKIQQEVKVNLYSLDFANINKKYYLEIDGEQHYVDKKIIKHDIERTEELKKLGWNGFRVRWSKFLKLSFENRKNLINEIYKNIL